MTFDELHRKTVYYGSAAVAGIALALATSPGWSHAKPVYAFEEVGPRACLEDLTTHTLPSGPDGQPVCGNAPYVRSGGGRPAARLPAL